MTDPAVERIMNGLAIVRADREMRFRGRPDRLHCGITIFDVVRGRRLVCRQFANEHENLTNCMDGLRKDIG